MNDVIPFATFCKAVDMARRSLECREPDVIHGVFGIDGCKAIRAPAAVDVYEVDGIALRDFERCVVSTTAKWLWYFSYLSSEEPARELYAAFYMDLMNATESRPQSTTSAQLRGWIAARMT